VKLTLKIMLIIAAVYWIGNGLMALVVPAESIGGKADDSKFLVMTMKFWGVASLPLGLIAWLIRDAEPSKTRDSVVLAFTFFFILEALVSWYGATIDPASPHVAFGALEALIGVGFIYVGRSSMARSSA
jgi:hypothetical protein